MPAASPDEHRTRWRGLVRRGIPVMGVVVVTAVIAAIALYVYESNRRGALSLSNDLLDAIDRRISVQLRAYLSPPQQFLELARQLGAARSVAAGGADVERLALQALPRIPTITGFSYADPEGNFLFVVPNEQGGYDTKLIDRRGGDHVVRWTRRDAAGVITKTEDDPADTYDPRVRPWYTGAVSARSGLYWTDTYLFFTLRKPGITLAAPGYDDAGGLAAVFAVDLELASLCEFLRGLNIGISGKAIVVDRNGRVVAFPGEDWLRVTDANAVAPRLDELNDPVLARAYNRLSVEGYGRQVLDFGDRRIIVSSEPLKIFGRDWVVLIVVPESDFVGFVASSSGIALALSAVVVAIVAALAAFMAWRGLQAERRAQAATARQRVLESHARTFAGLARTPAVLDHASAEGLREALHSAASTLAARRVSLWSLHGGGRLLRCEASFDSEAGAYTAGLELHRDELPGLFASLAQGETIDTLQADRDARTAELSAVYLAPLGVTNIHLVPVMAADRAAGMLLVEQPRRDDQGAGLAEFSAALACLLALRLAPARGATTATQAAAGMNTTGEKHQAPATAVATREVHLRNTLLQCGSSVDGMGQGRIDQAAVAVVKLPEWLVSAQRPASGANGTTMDAIVGEVCQAIGRSTIGYAALLDDLIVLAAPAESPDGAATLARHVALAAIELRDSLLRLGADLDVKLGFRLAIDVGPVMVSDFGSTQPSRNIWGGAIGVAKALAGSGAPHTIGVSETAYELLSGDFLFRPSGRYFLPETGTMRTFVLVGQT